MSTLSQRLARLREAGMAPAGKAQENRSDFTLEENSEPGVPGQAGGTSLRLSEKSSDRVDKLRRGRGANPGSAAKKVSGLPPDTPPPGEGWEFRSDFFWERVIRYPAILPDIFSRPFVLSGDTAARNLIFYDLETTGLSGGAGNTAFLIGLGRQCGTEFQVHQLFLADYPGEEAMLRRYAEYISEGLPQVSYNGRSFDSQVLKTRFLLNRMSPPSLPQLDLLYPSRRLWRSVLQNLTLRTLETEVLDFHRIDDLPGSEAPDAWFEWLKGQPGRIEGVFRHNADDIVSLARLLTKVEEWGSVSPRGVEKAAGGRSTPSGAEAGAWGMAVQWSCNDRNKERQWLEAGRIAGDRRCAMELALRYRRDGDFGMARAIWEECNIRGSDFASAVELAKYWEHRERNPRRALDILEPLKELPLSRRHRRELDHRSSRLMRKISCGTG